MHMNCRNKAEELRIYYAEINSRSDPEIILKLLLELNETILLFYIILIGLIRGAKVTVCSHTPWPYFKRNFIRYRSFGTECIRICEMHCWNSFRFCSNPRFSSISYFRLDMIEFFWGRWYIVFYMEGMVYPLKWFENITIYNIKLVYENDSGIKQTWE